MPIISAQIVAGRSPDMKHLFMRELVEATVRTLGVPADSVRIILSEIPPEHWGIGLSTKADSADNAGR